MTLILFRFRRYLVPLVAAGCTHAATPKASVPPATPCLRWQVTVDNEFPFPVTVYVYQSSGRTKLGTVFPGVTDLMSTDSGQISFTPPLGQSLMVRGRQVRGTIRCSLRASP
jgi:hypothetical protein